MILERFREHPKVKHTWPYKSVVAVLELQDLHSAGNPGNPLRVAIDIHCGNLDVWGISFVWRTKAPDAAQIQACELLLKMFDSSFCYSETIGRLLLPIDTNEAFRDVDAFLSKIDSLLAFLGRNWAKFEEIAGGVAT